MLEKVESMPIETSGGRRGCDSKPGRVRSQRWGWWGEEEEEEEEEEAEEEEEEEEEEGWEGEVGGESCRERG